MAYEKKTEIPLSLCLYIKESERPKKENISSLARKYGVSIDMITQELEKGVDIESKYTSNKQIALRNALDNIKKDISYYTDKEKLESEIKKNKKG